MSSTTGVPVLMSRRTYFSSKLVELMTMPSKTRLHTWVTKLSSFRLPIREMR